MFTPTNSYNITRVARLILLLALGFYVVGCASTSIKPVAVEPSAQPSTNPAMMSAKTINRYNQAIAHIKKGNPDQAESILLALKADFRGHKGIITNLATVYFQQKKYQQASALCDLAFQENIAIAELYNIRGLIAVEEKKFADAEAHYKKAIQLKPHFANAHYNLALLYDIYFQDIPRAYAQYQEYLSHNPTDTDTKNWVDQLQYSLDRG